MAGLFDDLIPGAKPGAAGGGMFADLVPAKPKPAGFLRSVADLGIEAASGVARGVKATADAFGADNAVSRGADTVDKFAREYLSAAAKADDQRVSEIMAAAQDAGVWEQVKAAAEAFTVKPAGMVLNAFGTSVPTIAAAMIPGVGQAGVAARLGALGAMGAAQGAGAVKGSIYEAVKAEQIKAGASESEAEAAAVRAQEYGGENTANIAGGAALGGAASATGVQPVIAKMLQRGAEPVAQAQRGILQRALNPEGLLARTGMGALKEAPLEAAQGGQEQYASNIALQNEGFDTPAFRGVAGSAALEGLASAGPGAAFAALDKPATRAAAEPKPDPVAAVLAAPDVDTAIKAMAEGLTGAKKPAPAELPQMDAEDRREVLGLMQVVNRPGVSPNVARFAQARMDALLAPYRSIPTGEATELEQIPVGEATEYDPPADMVPRRNTEGRPLDMSQSRAVAGYVERMRGINTPAARAFVQDYRAGRITDEDVMGLIVPTRRADPTADERIAAAAAQAPKVEVRPGDILTADGMPYGSKTAANVRAVKEGLTPASVIEIPGAGWVVRPKEARNVNQPDVAGTAGQPVADGAGRPDAAVGGELAAGRVASDATGQQPGTAAAVAPGSAGDAPVGAGDATDAALTAPADAAPSIERNAFGMPIGYRPGRPEQTTAGDLKEGDWIKEPGNFLQVRGVRVLPDGRVELDLDGMLSRQAVTVPASKQVTRLKMEPTGPAAAPAPAPTDAPTFTEGQRVQLAGQSYTVTTVNGSAVKLQGADGSTKMVARNSKTFGQIQPATGNPMLDNPASWVIREKATGKVVMETFDRAKVDALNTAKYEAVPAAKYLGELNGKPQESNEAARPQAQAAAGESAAPAAAPAPAAPAVVPGTGGATDEAGRLTVPVRTFGSSGYQLTMAQALAKVKELEADARRRKTASTKAPTAIMRGIEEDAASRAATLARKLREDIKQAVNSYPDARAEYAEARGEAQPASAAVETDGLKVGDLVAPNGKPNANPLTVAEKSSSGHRVRLSGNGAPNGFVRASDYTKTSAEESQARQALDKQRLDAAYKAGDKLRAEWPEGAEINSVLPDKRAVFAEHWRSAQLLVSDFVMATASGDQAKADAARSRLDLVHRAVRALIPAAATPNAEAPAVVPGATSGAVEADGVKQPDRVKVMTRQGQNVYVERADLESDKPRMRHFTSTGKSLGLIVRENLDPTGELRRADAKEAAENPLFDAIGTKDGRVFASEAAAARELSQRGLKDTHEVAPEGNGFIVKRRAPEAAPQPTGGEAAPAPAPEAAPVELPRLPVDAYRVERRYANGAVIRPLPGKTFADGEVQQIADWFRAAKWEVSTAAPSGVSAVNNANMSADEIPEPYTAAQRKKDERQREADTATAAKTAAQDDYLTGTAAGKYVAATFGDALNKFNSVALAKFLAGDADTFAGLMNARAADVVQGMGITVEGRATKDVLADLKARFAGQSAPTPERTPKAQAVKEALAGDRQPFEHAGLKVYPTKMRRDGAVVDVWAVQLPENKGTDKVLGDTLHTTIDEAKKSAEYEAKRDNDRKEWARKEEADRADSEAKKEANRGKNITERAADFTLNQPNKLPPSAGLGTGTRREAMDKAVEQGRAIRAETVEDTAAKNRDKKAVEAVSKAGYLLGLSNENIPVVKAGLEARARLKADKYPKIEYRVYGGRLAEGPFHTITKIEYDYAVQRQAEQFAAEQDRPTPAPMDAATHKDPGEPAEPVTPAVVREAIKTGVQATDRKPSAMKADLLQQIDDAVKEAPDYPDFEALVKQRGDKEAREFFTMRAGVGEKAAPEGYSRPKRTFRVEGDGVFTVNNTVRQLLTFRASVESSPGFKDRQAPAGLTEKATTALDRRSTDAAIANMVDEGDFQAALDFAEAKGVDIANVKLTKLLRDRLEKWQKDQASAKAVADYEAARAAPPEAEAPAPSVATQQAEPEKTPTPAAQEPAGRDEQPEAQALTLEAIPKSLQITLEVEDEGGKVQKKVVGARRAYLAAQQRVQKLQALKECVG